MQQLIVERMTDTLKYSMQTCLTTSSSRNRSKLQYAVNVLSYDVHAAEIERYIYPAKTQRYTPNGTATYIAACAQVAQHSLSFTTANIWPQKLLNILG